MSDPDEGVAADGTIRTGVRRDRVPALFEDVLRDAVARAARRWGEIEPELAGRLAALHRWAQEGQVPPRDGDVGT